MSLLEKLRPSAAQQDNRADFVAFLGDDDSVEIMKRYVSQRLLPHAHVVRGNVDSAIQFLQAQEQPPVQLLIDISTSETPLSELARLADHLVVLDGGQVTAAGPVDQVLSSVQLPVVLGDDAGALLRGQVLERDTTWHLARVGFAGGAMWLRDSGLPVGQPVRLRVLARDVSLTVQEPMQTSIQNHLPCVIDSIAPDAHPSQALVRLRCGESFLLARVTHRSLHALGVAPGSAVWAQVKSVAIVP